MATQEIVLRPGDSISLRLEVPGQALRLDMSLTPDGMAVSGPVPMGAPTIYGGVPPTHEDNAPVDLTAEFQAEDEQPADLPQQKVESLAAVEPFDPAPQALDIPFEDITEDTGGMQAEEVLDDATASDDLDLDMDDLDGEEIVSVADDDGGIDIPGDDDDLEGGDLSIDIPGDDDIEGGDLSIDIPEDDDVGGLSVDIPDDDGLDIEGGDEPDFSADAMTMVPPTSPKSAPALAMAGDDDSMSLENMSLDDEVELDEHGNPKDKFAPNPDDTLPVWKGKARTYRDPELEKKKKETSKLNKASQPAPAAPAPKAMPAKAKLPGAAKKPITKQIKKPGAALPAAASAKKPAVGGGGNFTVFLSPPKGADKKQAAAEIIAEIQGIDMNSAAALAGKMIVPVVKGVSETEAQGVRDRFKDAGLSCRITQKR